MRYKPHPPVFIQKVVCCSAKERGGKGERRQEGRGGKEGKRGEK